MEIKEGMIISFNEYDLVKVLETHENTITIKDRNDYIHIIPKSDIEDVFINSYF